MLSHEKSALRRIHLLGDDFKRAIERGRLHSIENNNLRYRLMRLMQFVNYIITRVIDSLLILLELD